MGGDASNRWNTIRIVSSDLRSEPVDGDGVTIPYGLDLYDGNIHYQSQEFPTTTDGTQMSIQEFCQSSAPEGEVWNCKLPTTAEQNPLDFDTYILQYTKSGEFTQTINLTTPNPPLDTNFVGPAFLTNDVDSRKYWFELMQEVLYYTLAPGQLNMGPTYQNLADNNLIGSSEGDFAPIWAIDSQTGEYQCQLHETLGCMDSGNCTVASCGYDSPFPGLEADNYNSSATVENGSCEYSYDLDSNGTLFFDTATKDKTFTRSDWQCGYGHASYGQEYSPKGGQWNFITVEDGESDSDACVDFTNPTRVGDVRGINTSRTGKWSAWNESFDWPLPWTLPYKNICFSHTGHQRGFSGIQSIFQIGNEPHGGFNVTSMVANRGPDGLIQGSGDNDTGEYDWYTGYNTSYQYQHGDSYNTYAAFNSVNNITGNQCGSFDDFWGGDSTLFFPVDHHQHNVGECRLVAAEGDGRGNLL